MSALTPRKPRRNNILAHQKRLLVRELALEFRTRADLAREYGVYRSAITAFATRNAREIAELRAALGDEVRERLAGLWIADQGMRVALYQRIAEDSVDEKSVIAALRSVAEELGQLPPRANVIVTPVLHVIEGVDVEALK